MQPEETSTAALRRFPDPTFRTTDYYVSGGPAQGMRPGTELRRSPVYFMLNSGGMGDFVNYSAALLWAAENCPWVTGIVCAPEFFRPFLRHVLMPYLCEERGWSIHPTDTVDVDEKSYVLVPDLFIEGKNVSPQLINATGSHLMDLGFMYYVGKERAPQGVTLPRLSLTSEANPAAPPTLGPYAVFTPGCLTPSRLVTGKHLTPLIEYTVSKGLTPVFLGKSEFSADLDPTFPQDIRYDLGIDLRNKTDILQAGAIMEGAEFVLGLDNGLLHLAACTSANVIFGYNIAAPRHRKPRRTWGHTVDVTLDSRDLPCNHCQSNLRLIVNHNFHNCIYGDNRCIDLLFGDSCARFKQAIDFMLGRPSAEG